MEDPDKMKIKLTYNLEVSRNKPVRNIPDGTQYFSEAPRSNHYLAVGPSREVLHVGCGKQICRDIPKLYEALQEHKHNDPGMFQNDDPGALRFFFNYLEGIKDLPEDRIMMVTADVLLKAFVFAERYGYEKFFNFHLKAFVQGAYRELCKGLFLADQALIRYVYDETRTGSPIRRMIVDSYVWDRSWAKVDTEACIGYISLIYLSEGEGVPVFEKEMEDSFRQRESDHDRGIKLHPFRRSAEEVCERYKFTVVPTGAWTTEAVLRKAEANKDQQAGPSGFNLVMR